MQLEEAGWNLASNQHDHEDGASKQASLESIWKRKVNCTGIVQEIQPMRFCIILSKWVLKALGNAQWRKFICNKCDYALRGASDLRKHLKPHSALYCHGAAEFWKYLKTHSGRIGTNELAMFWATGLEEIQRNVLFWASGCRKHVKAHGGGKSNKCS